MKSVLLLCVLSLGASFSVHAKPIPTDPTLVTGELNNGVKWIYMKHGNPPGRMSLLLHVRTGSVNETDEQAGVAHFLEHMVFNGSENFAPGDFQKYIKEIGMEFGADLNASTSFDQTMYMLFLPSTSTEEFNRAMMAMSDMAFRAKLDPAEIDKEREIILAEKTARSSPQQRVMEKMFPELFLGSLIARRIPIGLESVIKTAPREQFENYYRTWYRPENMTLIMVGDADPEQYIPFIQKWFGEYVPTVPAKSQADAGLRPIDRERAVVIKDQDLSAAQVQIVTIRPSPGPTTTYELARDEIIYQIGGFIVSRRFQEDIQAGKAPFRGANLAVSNFFNAGLMASSTAVGSPQDWNKMLEAMIQQIRTGASHGFEEHELEQAKRALMSGAERAIRTEESQSGRTLLMRLARSVNAMEPVTSAEQTLEIFKEILPTITLEEVNKSFAKTFAPGAFCYVVTLPDAPNVRVPTRQEVMDVVAEANEKTAAERENAKGPETLMTELPESGTVLEESVDKELGITSAWLSNGARIHHREMDYKKDTLYVSVSFGGGRLEESSRNAGITEVASLVFMQPATSKLTSSQIADMRIGRNVQIQGSAETDALTVSLAGSPRDLEFGMQLLHVLLTDGTIEQSAYDNWALRSAQSIEQGQRDPQFRAFEMFLRLTSGNDPRRTMLDKVKLELLSRKAAQSWLERIRDEAPLEIAIVGDISKEDAFKLAAQYLGSLKKRSRSVDQLDSLRKTDRGEGPYARSIIVPTASEKAVALYGFMGCEASEADEARRLEVAAMVLSERMNQRLREELQLVYSIQASNAPSRGYEDSGLFMTTAPCDPAKITPLRAELATMFARFATDGPTADETTIAINQIKTRLESAMREPAYWHNVLSHLDLHDVKLSEEKRDPEAYTSITADEVKEVFSKYFKRDRTFDIAAVPHEHEAPAAPAGMQPNVPAGAVRPRMPSGG